MSRELNCRLFEICRSLADGEIVRPAAMAARFERSPRTIHRDIQELINFYDAPIKYSQSRHGYYCTDPSRMPHLRQPLRLSEGELLAVCLGRHLLQQCAGSVIEDRIRGAFERIAVLLPDRVTIEDPSMLSSISLDLPPARGDVARIGERFAVIEKAVQDHKLLQLRYFAAKDGQTSERTVEPLHLHYHNGAWYMLAFCRLRGEMRYFALDRMERLEETGEEFDPLSDFDIDDYLHRAFDFIQDGGCHEISVRFSPAVARWVRERSWHHTQSLEEGPDGSLTLSMCVSGLDAVRRWVLGFGRHAEVLAPEALREAVREEAMDMVGAYT